MTARNYCFTCFDITKKPELGCARYVVFQLEKSPETGKLHYQGYVEFNSNQRISGAKKWYGCDTVHFEKRRGTRDQARDYCMKPESRIEGPWELGEWIKGQGHRTDLEEVADLVKSGKSNREIAEEHPKEWIKYEKGIKSLRNILKYDPDEWSNKERDIVVWVLWGPQGSGKTSMVVRQYGWDNIFIKTEETSNWWCGYKGQTVLLLDDFEGGIPYSSMLHILDRYPLQLQTKGGMTWAAWTIVIITSNKKPEDWYPGQGLRSLARRIHKVCHVPKWEGNTVPPTSDPSNAPGQ